MSIPNRPGSRAENLYGNMIGQETATPPEKPQSRIEEYLDYIVNNGTQLEQEIKDDVDALKGIGRYLSLWDCTTGKPVTDPKKLPYKYKSGDYYIVSAVGATNYMPSGTQYEGTASSTTDSGVSVNDFYLFDGTTWSRMAHSSVDPTIIAVYTQGQGSSWSCNLEFDTIWDALRANHNVIAYLVPSSTEQEIYLADQIKTSVTSNVPTISIEYMSLLFTSSNGTAQQRRISDRMTSNGRVISAVANTNRYLPSVTASDEGKVLGVTSSGSWDKADVHDIPSGGTTGQVLKKSSDTDYDATWDDESGGGGGADAPLVVNFSKSGDNIVCDTSIDDILAASAAGKMVYGLVPNSVLTPNLGGTLGIMRLQATTANQNHVYFYSENLVPGENGSPSAAYLIRINGYKLLSIDRWAYIAESVMVNANPTLSGTETALTGLKIGETNYSIPWQAEFIDGSTILNNDETSNLADDFLIAFGAWTMDASASMGDFVTYTTSVSYDTSATFAALMTKLNSGSRPMIDITSGGMYFNPTSVASFAFSIRYDGTMGGNIVIGASVEITDTSITVMGTIGSITPIP